MAGLTLYVKRDRESGPGTLSIVELCRGVVCLYRGYGIEHTPVKMAAGTYDASITRSPRFSKEAGHDVFTWEVQGVFDGPRLRQGIRIHPANKAEQLDGCLALGMNRVDLDGDGDLDVASSKHAMEIFGRSCGADTTMKVVVTDPAVA